MGQDSEKGGDDRVVKYLAAVCSNLQHNENMRNRLFQFYLVIAGSFLVVLQATNTLKEYETYAQVVATTSMKWWSLTSCIAFSTAIIAAVLLSVGFRQLLEIAWYNFGILAVLLATLTYAAVKLLNLMARGKKRDLT